MITNLPDAAGLDAIARDLHFAAWKTLIDILSEFRLNFDYEGDFEVPSSSLKIEWEGYVEACQSDLQVVCTLLQQSNELALKARLAEVNPLLLLLGTETKFTTSAKPIDFTELRTIDAVDLPGAVNTVTPRPLSDNFIQFYGSIRSLRNKIAHLGTSGAPLDPHQVLHALLSQYSELWAGRAWLQDRLEFATRARTSYFHDDKHQSPIAELMDELPYTFRILTNSEFKALLGQAKGKRRYLCLECANDRTVRRADMDVEDTAYLDDSGSAVACVLCGHQVNVRREECCWQDCKGNVLATAKDDSEDTCLTCHEKQEEIEGDG